MALRSFLILLLPALFFTNASYAFDLGLQLQRFRSDKLDAFTGPRTDVTSYSQSPAAEKFSTLTSLEASFPIHPEWSFWIRAGIPQTRTTTGTPSQQSSFTKKTNLKTFSAGIFYQKKWERWFAQVGFGVGQIWLQQSYQTSGTNSSFRATAWTFETLARVGYAFLEGNLLPAFGVQYLGTSQFKGSNGTGIYSDFQNGTQVQVLQGNAYEKMKWTSVNWVVSLTWHFAKPPKPPVLDGADYENNPEF